MKIQVLALDGIFDTGLATVLDVFTTANEPSAMLALGIAPFEVKVAELRRAGAHLPGPCRAAFGKGSITATADWLVIPAIGHKTPESCWSPHSNGRMWRDAAKGACRRRPGHADRGGLCRNVCPGGIRPARPADGNDDRLAARAAVSPALSRAVELDDGHMLIKSGAFVTAGAALWPCRYGALAGAAGRSARSWQASSHDT